MSKEKSNLEGFIKKFEGEKKIIAVVETKYGEALLDVNVDINLRIEIGDRIIVEDADFYVDDGRIVTVVGSSIEIDGFYITWKIRE